MVKTSGVIFWWVANFVGGQLTEVRAYFNGCVYVSKSKKALGKSPDVVSFHRWLRLIIHSEKTVATDLSSYTIKTT